MRDNILTKKLLAEIADIHRFTDGLSKTCHIFYYDSSNIQ